MPLAVNIVVEDVLSEAVLRAMIKEVGRIKVQYSYPIRKGWQDNISQTGYGYIKKNLPAYNAASESIPFIVLVDGDDRLCPPETIAEWLAGAPRHRSLVFRIAVREVEAWLLADKDGLANHLRVLKTLVPDLPESVADPKQCIIDIAARSRSHEVRSDLVPVKGTSATTGPYYSRAMSGFARDTWDITAAALKSDSLARAMRAIRRLLA